MDQSSTRMRARRLLPRLIGWLFGALWGLGAALTLPRGYKPLGCAIALATALAFLLRLWKRMPASPSRNAMFRTPAYLLAVAAEGIGICLASLLLPRFGGLPYLYSTIGLIVGLHFIGLWRATGSRSFLIITMGMCFVSLLSMGIPLSWRSLDLRYALLGIGNALVLWVGAGVAVSPDDNSSHESQQTLFV